MRAPSGSSLPRLGPRSAANAVLRPLFSAVRGGTVTDVNSVVITKENAILLPNWNLYAQAFTHTRRNEALSQVQSLHNSGESK